MNNNKNRHSFLQSEGGPFLTRVFPFRYTTIRFGQPNLYVIIQAHQVSVGLDYLEVTDVLTGLSASCSKLRRQ